MSQILRKQLAATDVALRRQVERLKGLASKAHKEYKAAKTADEARDALERYDECQEVLGRIRFGGLA